MPQGAMHIVGGGFAGGVQGLTSAQIRRDRRRERAARTMPLDVDSLVCEPETLGAVAITIDHCAGAPQVPALEQQGLRAQRPQCFQCGLGSRIVIDTPPEQQLGLGYVGREDLNVNGLAGSIELYFGKDVLKNGTGLMPVQWRGYSEGIKQYQGEVTQKSKLLATFNDRVAQCRKDSARIAKTDWSGIDAILQTIFHAFDVKPTRARVRRAK